MILLSLQNKTKQTKPPKHTIIRIAWNILLIYDKQKVILLYTSTIFLFKK